MQTEYTPDMLVELVKCSEDPVYFINNYCFLNDPILGKIPFKLYDFQEAAVRALHENRLTLLMQGRQTGKTCVLAAYAYWFSIFNYDKYTLLGSLTNAVAAGYLNRARFIHENVPDWMKPKLKYNNKQAMEFDNGSIIRSVAMTECMGRGMTCSLILLDEFAYVSKRIQDELWNSLYPMIACTHAKFVISSTPNWNENGKIFEELWKDAIDGKNAFHPIMSTGNSMPGRDQVWKEKMVSLMGEANFRQEYQCEFLS